MLVRKSEIKRQREDNEWPREGETWSEFLQRRLNESERDRRFARHVFIILTGVILFGYVVNEALMAVSK